MHEDLKQIPLRIRELREILEIAAKEMAEKLGISEEQYLSYENGRTDIPISALYDIAAALNVDFTVLLTGEQPRMNTACVVRKGDGVEIDRFKGYSYSSLAYNFIGKIMEPMLVTLEPDNTDPKLVMHGGQEFNYILSGKVLVTVGNRKHELTAGDSIYFDPRLPHSQRAVGETSTFLTVIHE